MDNNKSNNFNFKQLFVIFITVCRLLPLTRTKLNLHINEVNVLVYFCTKNLILAGYLMQWSIFILV